MILIRPIAKDDFDAYLKLSLDSHINFYTLPKSERLVEHLFEKALNSFSNPVIEPDQQFYLFVAEDTESKKLLGVSAISATSGGNTEPACFFRKEYITVESPLSQVVKKLPILNTVSYVRGPSEACSLFVDPSSRGSGVGKLLSLSRFLFAASFPERFTGSFISELRGKIEDGSSIFWEAIGRHFFDVSFSEIQEMLNYGHGFISHFLPEHPIYIDLLPKEIQDSIGTVDEETKAAFNMLVRLGFEMTDEIDVIDGGPKLQAKREAILPIIGSIKATVTKIEPIASSEHTYIVANENINFRAMFAPVIWESETSATISPEVAARLKIGLGDPLRAFDPKSI